MNVVEVSFLKDKQVFEAYFGGERIARAENTSRLVFAAACLLRRTKVGQEEVLTFQYSNGEIVCEGLAYALAEEVLMKSDPYNRERKKIYYKGRRCRIKEKETEQ